MADQSEQATANIFKALSNPVRIKIIKMLIDEPLCVCKIFEGVKMKQSNISQHLDVLKKSGILESRKEGLKVIYNIKFLKIVEVLKIIENEVGDSEENQRREV